MTANTTIPKTSEEQWVKAESFLDLFAAFLPPDCYLHRSQNPYLQWLTIGKPQLKPAEVLAFLNCWYPISRHQPQMLLRLMAAFPDWKDRHKVYLNYREEDGMVKSGDDPHYDLLEQLIIKLGGKLAPDPETEGMVTDFHHSLDGITAAEATGVLAAIEHPALDISDYFQALTRIIGREELAQSDPYLYIHVDVEPKHIIWSHGNALDWIEDAEKQNKEGYTKAEIISAYRRAMEFWGQFWRLAFAKLNYPMGQQAGLSKL